MTTIVKQLLAWMESNARAAQEREVERFLSQATDAADLERRVRQFERR